MLETKNLMHIFENGTAGLDKINFALQPGSFTVLSGANGSGKTLLMKHLVGLEQPTSGQILWEGKPAAKQWAEVRQRVGFLFQNSLSQILEAEVAEDISFTLRLQNLKKQEIQLRQEKVVKLCGLQGKEHYLTSTLSGGEQRRLCLAGLLTQDPEVLLLDEPFTGLDLPGVQAFLSILVDLNKQGKTILLVTHDLDKCLAHADTLILFYKGQILAQGSPKDVWNKIPEAQVFRPHVEISELGKLSWLL